MMHKISIIVPFFNAERYLDRCITSLCKQKIEDIEIILVNDGSTDGGTKICGDYMRNDPRIRLLQTNRLGPGGARNVGIEAAQGEFVAFTDADDFVEPDMFIRLYDATSINHCEISSCGFDTLKAGKYTPEPLLFPQPKLILEKDEINDQLLPLMMAGRDTPVWNKIFKRKWILSNNIHFNSQYTWGEDYLFSLEAVMSADRICRLSFAGYHYLQRPGSLSQTDFLTRLQQAEDIYLRKCDLIAQNAVGERSLFEVNDTWFMHHVGRAVEYMLCTGKRNEAIATARRWITTTGTPLLNDRTAYRRYRMLCKLRPANARIISLKLRLYDMQFVRNMRQTMKRILKR